ncbi:MAG: GAF domain-containing protein, partial [Betaproteobacteria bacterium]|nr:GAF domain-containing protein [Betaproteobacteria bacterium]
WIGQPDEHSGVVRPLARFGVGTGFLDQVKISVLADSPHGWGATGNAYRSGRGYIVNDYLNDPATLSWRQQARLTGWRSSGSFPIFREGRVAVILGLYHTEPGVFDVEMV